MRQELVVWACDSCDHVEFKHFEDCAYECTRCEQGDLMVDYEATIFHYWGEKSDAETEGSYA